MLRVIGEPFPRAASFGRALNNGDKAATNV